MLTSTEGAVDLLYDYDAPDGVTTLAYAAGEYVGDNGSDLIKVVPDAVIKGDATTGTRSVLQVLSGKDLKIAGLKAELADVSLRTTQKNANKRGAEADVLFDRIDAEQTNLRVDAAGNIEALHDTHNNRRGEQGRCVQRLHRDQRGR